MESLEKSLPKNEELAEQNEEQEDQEQAEEEPETVETENGELPPEIEDEIDKSIEQVTALQQQEAEVILDKETDKTEKPTTARLKKAFLILSAGAILLASTGEASAGSGDGWPKREATRIGEKMKKIPETQTRKVTRTIERKIENKVSEATEKTLDALFSSIGGLFKSTK